MVTDSKTIPHRGIIVGNYCHDILLHNNLVIAETLGGAASFISTVLDALSLPFHLVSKVGPDFSHAALTTNHPPLVVSTSQTTLFHAHFGSDYPDRILNRVGSCDPITPSEIPSGSRFEFGMAVGVGGEILPETLEKMLEICDFVFVDIQGLIRRFEDKDGRVNHVGLKESGFFHLLPKISFLKASEDEALFIDLEEVRKWCCVVVTHGKDGCEVFCKDGCLKIDPFEASQVDPTGAGDCFLGGFAAGIVQGLDVYDAALLGNFFGSLAVAQVGPPSLDMNLVQVVKEEMNKRKVQDTPCSKKIDELMVFRKSHDQDQFYASLVAAKDKIMCQIQENGWKSSPKLVDQSNVKAKPVINSSVVDSES
ncbi:inositol 3-kinase [Trifolium repens]|nr:inositol 3-kinase [Trifolium repens]